jgi:hypothetical protein
MAAIVEDDREPAGGDSGDEDEAGVSLKRKEKAGKESIFAVGHVAAESAGNFGREEGAQIDLALLAGRLELPGLNQEAMNAAEGRESHEKQKRDTDSNPEQPERMDEEEIAAERILVDVAESKTAGKKFFISTEADTAPHYVRYEPKAIDDEMQTADITEIRMEDELSKLKTANTDELEASLMAPQAAIGQQMSADFRMRKLDAALSDLQRQRQSSLRLH